VPGVLGVLGVPGVPGVRGVHGVRGVRGVRTPFTSTHPKPTPLKPYVCPVRSLLLHVAMVSCSCCGAQGKNARGCSCTGGQSHTRLKEEKGTIRQEIVAMRWRSVVLRCLERAQAERARAFRCTVAPVAESKNR
jgi:hypothetical protein